MSLKVHYFNRNGLRLIDCIKVYDDDKKFFQDNNIKVSMVELDDEIVVYGCPYSDESEKSEVMVFTKNRPCEDVLHELMELCKKHFGVEE